MTTDPRQLSFPGMPALAPADAGTHGELALDDGGDRLAPGLKTTRAVLALNMPLGRWLKTASPYTWRVEKRAPTPPAATPADDQEV